MSEEKKNGQKNEGKNENLTPEEALRRLSKGTLKLKVPIKARDKELTELCYDFGMLTGLEYVDAMDSDRDSKNIFKVSNKQALSIFAKAAAKCTEDVDEVDICQRISVADTIKAVQTATVFLVASSRAEEANTSEK